MATKISKDESLIPEIVNNHYEYIKNNREQMVGIDFTWEQFIEKIPEDAECVQLLTIRGNFDTFELLVGAGSLILPSYKPPAQFGKSCIFVKFNFPLKTK